MTPISKTSAVARIHSCGLTLEQAVNMSDSELLSLPFIGRRTLRFIRSLPILET